MTTKKQMAAALQACIPYLARTHKDYTQKGQTEYICFALERGLRGAGSDWDAVQAVTRVVERRLYPANNMHSWLIDQGYLGNDNSVSIQKDGMFFNVFDEVQAHRHAWVQELIKEFSK